MFFSDTAAPLIRQMVVDAGGLILEDIEEAGKVKEVRAGMSDKYVAERYDKLKELAASNNGT